MCPARAFTWKARQGKELYANEFYRGDARKRSRPACSGWAAWWLRSCKKTREGRRAKRGEAAMGLQVYRILAEVAEQQSFSKAGGAPAPYPFGPSAMPLSSWNGNTALPFFCARALRCQPTEEGRRLLPEICGLLRMEENLRGAGGRHSGGVGERVRLGVFGSFSARYLSALAAAFCAKFPRC